ncbi:cupin domain-containing protein [Achromobacter xylosoxidans]|uniref:Anti-sigma factor n=1 Tax=Alcaligenes xylosoxydans xylosoxydans TaxID=85698 RepID=A0A0X8P2X6_ALCXX|nr:cupin domain-containing protein [Achromobacter xylosoxidans]AMG38794.1 anti-sigma factor [Achromobacter xylosoxidans]
MLVNADFSRPASVSPAQYRWIASPQGGVERVLLDRVGAEQARATSIVRYAPDSQFPRHAHPGGEEILVLSGTFSDDGGDYSEGWYLRNPPGSSHRPHSAAGAMIFVKLRQMASTERGRVRIDTRDPSRWRHAGGRAQCPLYQDGRETVSLLRLVPGLPLLTRDAGGAEVLVLAGALTGDGRLLEQGSWLRQPCATSPALVAGAQGATVYLKTGHLAGARETR